jgi:hypothetical protein
MAAARTGSHSDRHASTASSGAESWTSQETIKGLFGSRRHTPVKISTDKGLRYADSPARRRAAFFVCARRRRCLSLFQIPSHVAAYLSGVGRAIFGRAISKCVPSES